MADTELSDLVELLGSEIDYAADWLYVDDVSAAADGGKKVHPGSLLANPLVSGTITVGPGGLASLPDGSAAAPCLCHTGHVDTGVYFADADVIAMAAAGVQCAKFDANGITAIPTNNRYGLIVANSDGSSGGIQMKGGGVALHNIFIGNNVGWAITTGTNNIGLGANSLLALTGGTTNVAIGYQCLKALIGGSNNVAIGTEAAISLTTGTYNVVCGYRALYDATEADQTVAIGQYAATNVTTADNNVAVGANALYTATDGADNVALGRSAMYSTTGGDKNVAVGMYSQYGNTTGNNNTCVGYGAGRFYGAGSSALTDAENSIYIGYQARGAANTDDNTICIGYDVVALGANTTVLGNTSTTISLMYGAHRLSTVAAPTAVADNCFIYSADQTAGNACPHILTENNKTLKLYQGAAIADAGAGEAETQLNLLLAHLRLMGIIAT